MNPQAGILVRCVYCKAEKTLTWAEAQQIKDVPFCEKDGGVMYAVSATFRKETK